MADTGKLPDYEQQIKVIENSIAETEKRLAGMLNQADEETFSNGLAGPQEQTVAEVVKLTQMLQISKTALQGARRLSALQKFEAGKADRQKAAKRCEQIEKEGFAKMAEFLTAWENLVFFSNEILDLHTEHFRLSNNNEFVTLPSDFR